MQAQYRQQQPYARLNNFHGPKRQLLGHAGHVPPAWRNGNAGPSTGSQAGGSSGHRGNNRVVSEPGSRIFLSRLPMDVGEVEVEELFKKTVGPLKESFVIYNSQGKSKGMAVVAFQRPGDAAVAQSKYHGKIVDGRRPIQIQIIVDSVAPAAAPAPPAAPPSLFQRLQAPAPVAGPSRTAHAVGGHAPASLRFATPVNLRRQPHEQAAPPRPATPYNATTFPAPIPPRRFRTKKGPKRLKKQAWVSKSADQLDREMEDYRAESVQFQDDVTG